MRAKEKAGEKMKLKLKTRKSAAKRVNEKKSIFARKKAFRSHFLRRKNSKRLRSLEAPATIHKADKHAFALMLPY